MNEAGSKRGAGILEVVFILALAAVVLLVMFRPTHRVGVIDMGRVATGLGIDRTINDDARATREMALAKIKRMEDALKFRKGELDRKLKSAGADKDRDKLQGDLKAAEQAFQESVDAIRREVQAHEMSVLRSFRDRLSPAIEAEASKRGLDLIADRSVGFAYVAKGSFWNASVDVTDAVIARSKTLFPKDEPLIPNAALPVSGPLAPHKR